jgi:hypothetical protein
VAYNQEEWRRRRDEKREIAISILGALKNIDLSDTQREAIAFAVHPLIQVHTGNFSLGIVMFDLGIDNDKIEAILKSRGIRDKWWEDRFGSNRDT